jgi:HK97 family phage major capsid protein
MKDAMRLPRVMYRDFEIELGERATDGEGGEVRYPVSFSSELPVLRRTWDGTYYEILSHKPADVDMTYAAAGLPALKGHMHGEQFGSVTGIKLKSKRSHGMLGFSSIPLGVEQKTLVDEGHLHTVSVGYRVLELTMIKKGEDGIPHMLAKWMPMEVSTVPVPADHTVGFGRSDGAEPPSDADLVTVQVRSTITEGGSEDMLTRAGLLPMLDARADGGGGLPDAPPTDVRAADPVPQDVRVTDPTPQRDLVAEGAAISELCAEHGIPERAAEWIRAKMTPGQVAQQILPLIATKTVSQPPSEQVDVLAPQDRSRYSIARALKMHTSMVVGERGAKFDGLEAEVHQELKKNRNANAEDHGGVLIPLRTGPRDMANASARDIAYASARAMGRALGTTEGTGGAGLVDATTMPEMIDLVRNKALCLVAGGRFYPGLQNVIHFNKKTGVPTVSWMAENPSAGASLTEPSYGYVQLSPKTLIGTVLIPRQLINMASIDVEADVRNDLAVGTGLAIDLGALHGKGTASEPEGIYSAADVQVKAFGGVPSITTLTDAAAKLPDANADLGAMSWMTTPLMAGVLKRTPEVSGYPTWLWKGTFREGELVGYASRATNQISKVLGAGTDEHGLIFGNWNDLLIGMWGNDLELIVDPYKYADKGQLVVTSFAMADTGVRRGASFVKGTGAKLA